jgi:hypothetical protein
VQTFAGIAPMAVALGEHRASLLGRCSFYAPFFNLVTCMVAWNNFSFFFLVAVVMAVLSQNVNSKQPLEERSSTIIVESGFQR